MDGGGSMQQRRFCTAKTRRQQMYRDVHFLTWPLLFPHISIQDDFFTGIAAHYHTMVLSYRYAQAQTYVLYVCLPRTNATVSKIHTLFNCYNV